MTSEALQVSRLFSVAGKVALITGATRGIGKMLARGLLSNGVTVYITSRDATAAEQTVAELSALGTCRGIIADVSTDAGIATLYAELSGLESRLDILVNNAGLVEMHPLGEYPASAWDNVLGINLRAPFMVTQALLPLLRTAASDAEPARVINMGSIGAHFSNTLTTYSYCASKAALAQLTRALARDLAGDRITVNVLEPGTIHTEMQEQFQSIEELKARTPLGRIGGTADLLGAVVYLSSAAGAWITGSTLTIDGGALVA